ncbi:MAG: helix-turn-helix transcriptional regulator [Sphingopyxis sp.]|nr:helix-turn-helix transcriptional regulator [Sphingopyxis sp.]
MSVSADPRALLDQLIRDRGYDYQSLSRLIGRNAAYIQQYIKRGTPRRLEEGDRRRIAAFLGVPDTMLGGPAATIAAPRGTARGPAMLLVPQLAIGASAGAGSNIDGEGVEAGFAFDPRWLRRMGADTRALSIIAVEGDSMAPTLNDGDDIMVDGGDAADRLRDGIYVLRMDDMLMVKRVARLPGAGRISVTSDNPLYPSWPDLAADAVTLVGRVVWAGRRVR